MATKQAAATETAAPEAEAEANVLDTQSAAVKRLIAKGKERGYITFDELNAVLPAEQNSSEQIEDIMAMLSEMGIQVVESEENEETETAAVAKEDAGDEEEQAGNISEASVSRTDDPVRMYLREMGTVELLSREGEIAIAKRIEAGRDMMIRGLCESPLTFRAIIAWHEALNNGRVLLRDVIDLEAMQAGNEIEEAGGDNFESSEEMDEDEEGEGAGMSLSALEEKLKPEIFQHFEEIEKLYDKLAKLQTKRIDNLTAGGDVNSRSEKAYEKLRDELVARVEQVRLHNNRIEELVAQLKVLNQRLTYIIKRAPLGKHGGLRPVHVFWLAVTRNTPAEGEHRPAPVTYREHNAAKEHIHRPVIALLHQPGLDKLVRLHVLPAQSPGQLPAPLARPAQPEAPDGGLA